MKTFQLNSGDKIPVLGLGTWKMTDEEAATAVAAAIKKGYRHVDGAWIYENEKGVGQGIATAIESGSVSRDDLWITSKLWNDRHEADQVEDALKGTISDLGLDCLDLYLIHWPVAQKAGVARPETAADYVTLEQAPIEATWQAMEACVKKGLCKNIGVSNFSAKKINELVSSAKIKPAINQVELHPFLQQQKLIEACRQHDILLTGYSPLGSGDRPDRMKKKSEPSLLQNETINAIAEQHQVTAAQINLAWAIQRGTIPIPKSSNADRQQQNLASVDIVLSEDQMQQITELDMHYRYVDGKFWEIENGPYTVKNIWDE